MKISNYKPWIDGLRAYAVTIVIAFHLYPNKFIAGYLGVDIFFVISGFLILQILIKIQSNDFYSILEFYTRRIIRIFPALLFLILCLIFITWFIFSSDEYRELGRHIYGAIIFQENYFYLREINYFSRETYNKPLLHLWSLSIEGQFYICVPFIFFILRKNIKLILLVIILIFIYTYYKISSELNSNIIFYDTKFRVWELLSGALVAIFIESKVNINKYRKILICINFLSIIILLYLPFSSDSRLIVVLLAVLSTTLFIVSSEIIRNSIVVKILSSKFLVYIGLISYPLYLWHWPLISINKIINGDQEINSFFVVVLIVLISVFTYEFVEKPLKKIERKKILLFIITFFIILGSFGYYLSVSDGFSRRAIANKIDKYIDSVKMWDYPGSALGIIGHIDDIPINSNARNLKEIDTIFFGDSHIEHFAPRVGRLQIDGVVLKNIAFITTGCTPIPPGDYMPSHNP